MSLTISELKYQNYRRHPCNDGTEKPCGRDLLRGSGLLKTNKVKQYEGVAKVLGNSENNAA